ncbi:hypothetical protein DL95DRAFT_399665 [Leptodontidium sp. 2 PMI_412]|nr:hypothetical protein DL95DRAFT_399665 [Leptodontidium sp. 2 PMI_412]
MHTEISGETHHSVNTDDKHSACDISDEDPRPAKRRTESKLYFPQVIDADRYWEVRKIVGKEYINGVLHYWVDWYPTPEPEDSLEHAMELVDDFEAQLQGQCGVKAGRGRPGLKRGEREVVEVDASGGQQHKRPRGRPRKQT